MNDIANSYPYNISATLHCNVQYYNIAAMLLQACMLYGTCHYISKQNMWEMCDLTYDVILTTKWYIAWLTKTILYKSISKYTHIKLTYT